MLQSGGFFLSIRREGALRPQMDGMNADDFTAGSLRVERNFVPA